MKLLTIFAFLFTLTGCIGEKYRDLKETYATESGSFLGTGIVFNSEEYRSVFKLGVLWNPTMKDNAILIPSFQSAMFFSPENIKTLTFILNETEIHTAELTETTKERFGNMKIFHRSTSGSHIYKAFLVKITDLLEIHKSIDKVKITVSTNDGDKTGDLQYEGFGSARNVFQDFIKYHVLFKS